MSENPQPTQEPQFPAPSPADFDPTQAADYAQKMLLPHFSDAPSESQAATPLAPAEALPPSEVETHEHQIINNLYDQIDSINAAKAADDANRNRREADQKRLAMTDELTQLYNRAGLKAQYQEQQGRFKGRRGTDNGDALLVIDLDHFKNVNDTYGHPVGDKVLKRVAQTLRSALREDDVVGRWGGEEFLVILPNTNSETAQIVAERIRTDIDNTPPDTEVPVHMTTCVGVGPLDFSKDLEDNVEPADKALYKAKQSGRNQVVSTYTQAA